MELNKCKQNQDTMTDIDTATGFKNNFKRNTIRW